MSSLSDLILEIARREISGRKKNFLLLKIIAKLVFVKQIMKVFLPDIRLKLLGHKLSSNL